MVDNGRTGMFLEFRFLVAQSHQSIRHFEIIKLLVEFSKKKKKINKIKDQCIAYPAVFPDRVQQ